MNDQLLLCKDDIDFEMMIIKLNGQNGGFE